MDRLSSLVRRNCLMFFRDKGIFFTSLITPLILLVLYATFLSNVYRESFVAAIPTGFAVSDRLVDALVGGQLFSSLLAVCCVTVAFCSNMLMVQDKVTGAAKDFAITPVKASVLSLGYYISTAISTLIIALVGTGACLIYIGRVGWYLSGTDVLCILLDVFLLVMFGTALSSIVNYFLSSQGQISAVGSIVSSCYGFICGAYMPISQFSPGLQKVLSFLPGTYATSLFRNHTLQGVFSEMESQGVHGEIINGFRNTVDCNIKFFDNVVEVPVMYWILGGWTLALILVYVGINRFLPKKLG